MTLPIELRCALGLIKAEQVGNSSSEKVYLNELNWNICWVLQFTFSNARITRL